jgi:hypothetical protein
LESQVNGLVEKLVCPVDLLQFESLFGLDDHSLGVGVWSLQCLDDWEHFRDVFDLERQILVVIEDVFLGQIDWGLLLFLICLISSGIILLHLVEVG